MVMMGRNVATFKFALSESLMEAIMLEQIKISRGSTPVALTQ